MKNVKNILKNESGSTFFQYYASITAILALVTCGQQYGWPSPSLTKLMAPDSEIPITENEGFWLATMPLFGALLGSLTCPFISNNFGRRITILLTSVPYLASWIMIGLAQNVNILYIARFIAGISDAWGFSAIPMYIGEISQPNIRGLLGSGLSISFIFGILIINVIGSYLSVKATALVCCLLPITLILTFIWMPESPYFLILKDRQDEARRSLQTFRGPITAQRELERITKAVKEDLSQCKSSPLDLFRSKRNFKAILVMMLLRGTQQLSGASAITFYSQNIFTETESIVPAHLASILLFTVQLICTIICGGLVDKLGRRPLVLFSVVGVFFVLLIEAIFFYLKLNQLLDIRSLTIVPVMALIGYIIFFSLGLQNIPLLIMSEIFHSEIKAVALCFSDIYFAVIATASSKFFQVTKVAFGMYVPFFCFSIFSLLGTILIYVFVPETKGKTLEDIQEYFKGNRKDVKEISVII